MQAVFQVLEDHIAAGKAQKLKNSLPPDIRELWPQPLYVLSL